jgi:hypothetical protein
MEKTGLSITNYLRDKIFFQKPRKWAVIPNKKYQNSVDSFLVFKHKFLEALSYIGSEEVYFTFDLSVIVENHDFFYKA